MSNASHTSEQPGGPEFSTAMQAVAANRYLIVTAATANILRVLQDAVSGQAEAAIEPPAALLPADMTSEYIV